MVNISKDNLHSYYIHYLSTLKIASLYHTSTCLKPHVVNCQLANLSLTALTSRGPQGGGVGIWGTQYVFHWNMRFVKSIFTGYAIIAGSHVCIYANMIYWYVFMQKHTYRTVVRYASMQKVWSDMQYVIMQK